MKLYDVKKKVLDFGWSIEEPVEMITMFGLNMQKELTRAMREEIDKVVMLRTFYDRMDSDSDKRRIYK